MQITVQTQFCVLTISPGQESYIYPTQQSDKLPLYQKLMFRQDSAGKKRIRKEKDSLKKSYGDHWQAEKQ